MMEDTLNDFLILRTLDDPITREQLGEAVEASGQALKELRGEDVDIIWVDSEVLTNDDGEVTGTFCHYRAKDEDTVREHGRRAGLPVTQIHHRGQPLEGESE
ncbi:MAG: DUF4242 domain-containing protein [Salinivenus sp.]